MNAISIQNNALYRKYRPKNFSEVIGQYFVVQTLKNAIKNNNINHAYIFSGSRGTGKTSVAKIFARAINCSNNNEVYDCCNECEKCLSNLENKNIDIVELDAASNNGVNEIKNVLDTLKYLPTNNKYKVYIIDEAHMLSNSAWNALLKTLEEPPIYIIFIFATTEFNKIPPTIISRCQRFEFNKLTNHELINLIEYVANVENILISNNSKNKIAQLSDGGARDCLSILDQLSNLTNKNIHLNDINNLFGLANYEVVVKLINFIIDNDFTNAYNVYKNLKNANINYLNLVNDLINFCLDKTIFLKTNNINFLKHLTINNIYDIRCNDTNKLIQVIDQYLLVYENMKQFGNNSIYLELEILKLKINHNIESNLETCINSSTNNNDTEIKQNNFDEIFVTKNITKQFINDDKNDLNIDIDNIDQSDNYNFNHLVNEKALPINPYNKSTIINHELNDIPDYNWEEIFLQIASNNNNEIKKIDSENINKFKNSCHDINQISNLITNITKVLVSSSNGLIVLFNFPNEANKFNKLFWTQDGFEQICNYLNIKNRLIYAIDKNIARNWIQIYKENKTKTYPDIKTSLLKYSKIDSDVKQKIFKILNSD